ncbi:M15 family metallopeptidase [uncultured Ferrimonas sp.]|uniref:M15 family metallopeptidase n=1 Tax=uncultured Ferrimonas sp. TaxID=432640 RepID=UPI00261492D0|nr:M15 family metallopeptidase [uncultured Ferrimonas sp.]
MLSAHQLLGLDPSHLEAVGAQQLERRCAKAFVAMQAAALADGIDLQLASGWRSFERQLAIFNGKASGQRPLQDRHGQACDPLAMSDADLLDAILAWSALPGTSRHHWGTDLDLYDANALPAAQLKLEPWEYQQGGPNFALSQWLNRHMSAYGFYRPYQQALGGVAPEPWHLSYAPVSAHLLNQFDLSLLEHTLSHSDIKLKASILAQLPGLVEQYCYRIAAPPQ